MTQGVTSELFNELSLLLQEVFDLDTVPQHNNGVYAIEFERQHTLCFEYSTQLDLIILYSALNQQIDIKHYSLLLLQANTFGMGTNGAHFVFDKTQNQVLLEQHFYSPLPGKDKFRGILSGFLDTLRGWEDKLLQLKNAETTGESNGTDRVNNFMATALKV